MIPLDVVAIFPNIPLELVKEAISERVKEHKSHFRRNVQIIMYFKNIKRKLLITILIGKCFISKKKKKFLLI